MKDCSIIGLETGTGSGTSIAKPRTSRKLALLMRSGLFSMDMGGATIKRAHTFEELRDAYSLVHDVYVKRGYIHPTDSGMRLRMFEAASEIATFIAKVGDRVVGVLSVIGDSEGLGLPSDAVFKDELEALRRTGARICEWSNQVVAEDYRKSGVATALMRCAAAHVIFSKYEKSVISVCASHKGFYDLLGFQQTGPERSYSDTIHDPVVQLSLESSLYLDESLDVGEPLEFIRNHMARSNPFLELVAQWSARAGRGFGDTDTLRRLFVDSNFIAECSSEERDYLRSVWGSWKFDAVTGDGSPEVDGSWFEYLADCVRSFDEGACLCLAAARA